MTCDLCESIGVLQDIGLSLMLTEDMELASHILDTGKKRDGGTVVHFWRA